MKSTYKTTNRLPHLSGILSGIFLAIVVLCAGCAGKESGGAPSSSVPADAGIVDKAATAMMVPSGSMAPMPGPTIEPTSTGSTAEPPSIATVMGSVAPSPIPTPSVMGSVAPSPSPAAKSCCACVYQEADPAGGTCDSRRTKDTCEIPNGPCSWQSGQDGGTCFPTYQGDCQAQANGSSPFHQAMQNAGNKCEVTGSFPNTTFIDTQTANIDNVKSWSQKNACTNLVVWYTGHGKNYSTNTNLFGQICEACPGGAGNTITCTGCSGMSGADPNKIRDDLCAKLKATGQAGSITTTGNQTEVTSYDGMSAMTITVSYAPPSEICTMDIVYAPCSEGRKSCKDTEAKSKVSFFCNSGKGIVKKTCTCGLFSCGFE